MGTALRHDEEAVRLTRQIKVLMRRWCLDPLGMSAQGANIGRMAITRRKLEQAEAAYQAAALRAEHNRERRNALVHEAVAEGWTHAQIAAATGLARSRISQLAPSRTERQRPPSTTAKETR